MSDHEHDDSHHGDHCGGGGGGGPDTRFLDFELDKVMYDEAESIVREAFRELLKEAAKVRMQEVWGKKIADLAYLAVDEALADNEANFQVQATIAARNDARRSLEDRIKAIITGDPCPEDDAGPDQGEGEGG